MKPSLPPLLLAALLSATAAWGAKERPFIDEPRPMSQTAPEFIEEFVWQEGEAKPPAYPEEANLVEFKSSRPNERFRYFLDSASIAVGKGDSVVRYSVVIASDSGARNVAYEGIRCETLEYKIYAYGSKGGQFQPVRQPQWKDLREDRYNRYRRDLYEDYFCENLIPRSLDGIRRALARGGERKGERGIGE